jgi:FAD/FMN-containing dehydrogenase
VCSVRYASFWPADAPADTSEANLRWIDSVHDALAPYVSREAVQSYADPGLPDWANAYYGSNLRRLVAVKRAYDPDNVFRYPQSIPTAI